MAAPGDFDGRRLAGSAARRPRRPGRRSFRCRAFGRKARSRRASRLGLALTSLDDTGETGTKDGRRPSPAAESRLDASLGVVRTVRASASPRASPALDHDARSTLSFSRHFFPVRFQAGWHRVATTTLGVGKPSQRPPPPCEAVESGAVPPRGGFPPLLCARAALRWFVVPVVGAPGQGGLPLWAGSPGTTTGVRCGGDPTPARVGRGLPPSSTSPRRLDDGRPEPAEPVELCAWRRSGAAHPPRGHPDVPWPAPYLLLSRPRRLRIGARHEARGTACSSSTRRPT